MSVRSTLRLYNSLTRTKDVFKPNNGNHVKFYICGPTVYDSAHMGHARAYISFDIVRRVLINYFNYDVTYIMNITDIDDKIIKRARQNHLYEQYVAANRAYADVAKDVISALKWYEQKCEAETDDDKKKMMYATMERLKNFVKGSVTAAEVELGETTVIDSDEKTRQLLASAKDILAEWQDSTFGHTVSNLDVFAKWAKKYENEFFEEMRQLNVKSPEIVTRVSEYIAEIETFAQRVIDNGYAYVADGSVYFDTEAFTKKHKYAKLVPEAYGDKENREKHLREGEGELSVGQDTMSKKRAPADFALWKSSKAGEPHWQSRWGRGRPGWHVECSVMCTQVCGDSLDIHAGGADLKFPHHDNEIAQCEAHYDADHWVNTFLHCGSLRIEGLKMSKSLKNFISIRDALKKYTPRQMRILFLMHNWWDGLDFSNVAMERALQFEKLTNEFFLNFKDLTRQAKADASEINAKYGEPELRLLAAFTTLKLDIHAALCDSIDTRSVIEKIRELINAVNIYIKEREVAQKKPHIHLLKTTVDYTMHLMRVFGAIVEADTIGYAQEASAKGGGEVDKEALLMPHLEALATFRENVRTMARTAKNVSILEECDRLRDKVMPPLGVRLEDKTSHTVVKLVDPAELIREQEQKAALEVAKREEKERKAAEKERKAREKQQKAAATTANGTDKKGKKKQAGGGGVKPAAAQNESHG